MNKLFKTLIITLISGCTAISVNASQTDVYDMIKTNTSFATGLDENDFSISNYKKQGVKISY